MKHIRSRFSLLRGDASDRGMGITEVIFAMAIFMIISVGVAYATLSTLRLAADSRAREVAANLAASEIDKARANGDPLTLFNSSRTVTIDGLDYTIVRTAGWVSSSGSSSGCGTGTGALQYKQVDVKVSWTTKLAMTADVRANTIVAPVTRINDPSYGTILVSALTAAGTPSEGIPVTVTATSSGAPVTMDATDVDGCSYAFKVTPGTYTVSVNKSGYVDSKQAATSITTGVTVVAGSAVSVPFQYDKAATFTLNYANNQAATANKLFPSNLDTSFISTYGLFQISSGTPSSIALHPFSSGYAVVAGKYKAPVAAVPPAPAVPGCLSPDPTSWAAGTVGTTALKAGVRAPNVAASPGGSAAMGIPMGVATFKYTGVKDRYIVAKTVAPPAGSGNPGCDTGMTYVFSPKLVNGSTYSVALPFGSWSLYTSATNTGSGTLTPITDAMAGAVTGLPSVSVITLDPRTP